MLFTTSLPLKLPGERHQVRHSLRTAFASSFTLNGRCYWMMNSSRHGYMVSSSCVAMVCYDDFILVFSLIPRTIQKSLSSVLIARSMLIRFARILLASIRNLGQCPCPRCLVQLSSVDKLGMRSDMRQRTVNARQDDIRRQSRVISARRLIYEKNHQVTSSAVEGLLKSESLVPTSVGVDSLALFRFNIETPLHRTRFRKGSPPWASISLRYLFQISSTSGTLVSGDNLKFIFCAYSNR